MTDRSYNSNDPSFLASRDLDGDLSPEERAQLERAIAASPTMREDAEEIRAVDRLVKQWAVQPVEVDWEHHAANIIARIECEETPAERAALDRVLVRWKSQPLDLDEDAFTTAVKDRLVGVVGSRTRRAWVWRLGVPLAAAAAVAIALTARIWIAPMGQPVAVVRFGSSHSADRVDGSTAAKMVSNVSYARAVVDRPTATDDEGWISIGSLGAGPPDGHFSEGPPI